MKRANFSLAEAKFSAGDFSSNVIQNVGNARLKLKARTDNVAGVALPIFEVDVAQLNIYLNICIAHV